MLSFLRPFVALLCFAFFAWVLALVSKEKLQLKYSLLWLALTFVTFLCALFPVPVYKLAALLGFDTASNFIFLVGCFFLIMVCISLSVIVSKQSASIKNLTQRIAILERELKE